MANNNAKQRLTNALRPQNYVKERDIPNVQVAVKDVGKTVRFRMDESVLIEEDAATMLSLEHENVVKIWQIYRPVLPDGLDQSQAARKFQWFEDTSEIGRSYFRAFTK